MEKQGTSAKNWRRWHRNQVIVKSLWWALGGFFALMFILFVLIYNGVIGYMPTIEALRNPTDKFASTLYTADGKEMGKFYRSKGNRTYVDYEQMSKYLRDALIATEDVRFEEHSGVDVRALFRSLVKRIIMGQASAGGGSTITQQLAKNTLFTQEKHLARKAAEMFAALAIEKQYNKEQIFEMYVNTIYFGSGHYGIGEAAQGYFGKTPLQLTDAEAVMLAGLPNAPSAYSPNSSPDLAVKRMQVVLNRMVGCKKLTREQADALAAEAVTLQFLPAS